MRTWKMCWLGDLPPNRFCLPALGQVAGVCLWIQPELKGCVDLALGQLCASQIFSFPSDNLSVVSSLATTKCLFYSQTSWGFHRSSASFCLPVWQMWGCWQGGLVTKAWVQPLLLPWLSGDFSSFFVTLDESITSFVSVFPAVTMGFSFWLFFI